MSVASAPNSPGQQVPGPLNLASTPDADESIASSAPVEKPSDSRNMTLVLNKADRQMGSALTELLKLSPEKRPSMQASDYNSRLALRADAEESMLAFDYLFESAQSSKLKNESNAPYPDKGALRSPVLVNHSLDANSTLTKIESLSAPKYSFGASRSQSVHRLGHSPAAGNIAMTAHMLPSQNITASEFSSDISSLSSTIVAEKAPADPSANLSFGESASSAKAEGFSSNGSQHMETGRIKLDNTFPTAETETDKQSSVTGDAKRDADVTSEGEDIEDVDYELDTLETEAQSPELFAQSAKQRGHKDLSNYSVSTEEASSARNPCSDSISSVPSSAGAARSSRRRTRNKQNPPRPLNSFILYRKDNHLKVLEKSGEKISNNEVSKILSQRWRDEPDHVKAKYKELAERAKEEHRKLYPDYRYRPRKVKPKRKKKGDEISDNERDVESLSLQGSEPLKTPVQAYKAASPLGYQMGLPPRNFVYAFQQQDKRPQLLMDSDRLVESQLLNTQLAQHLYGSQSVDGQKSNQFSVNQANSANDMMRMTAAEPQPILRYFNLSLNSNHPQEVGQANLNLNIHPNQPWAVQLNDAINTGNQQIRGSDPSLYVMHNGFSQASTQSFGKSSESESHSALQDDVQDIFQGFGAQMFSPVNMQTAFKQQSSALQNLSMHPMVSTSHPESFGLPNNPSSMSCARSGINGEFFSKGIIAESNLPHPYTHQRPRKNRNQSVNSVSHLRRQPPHPLQGIVANITSMAGNDGEQSQYRPVSYPEVMNAPLNASQLEYLQLCNANATVMDGIGGYRQTMNSGTPAIDYEEHYQGSKLGAQTSSTRMVQFPAFNQAHLQQMGQRSQANFAYSSNIQEAQAQKNSSATNP